MAWLWHHPLSAIEPAYHHALKARAQVSLQLTLTHAEVAAQGQVPYVI